MAVPSTRVWPFLGFKSNIVMVERRAGRRKQQTGCQTQKPQWSHSHPADGCAGVPTVNGRSVVSAESINKSGVGDCCIVRDCEFLRIAWLVALQCSRCLERANWEQTTAQGRRSDLKTIKWKVGQQCFFFFNFQLNNRLRFYCCCVSCVWKKPFHLFSALINFSV